MAVIDFATPVWTGTLREMEAADWASLSDQELLERRISKLGLRIEGTTVEPYPTGSASSSPNTKSLTRRFHPCWISLFFRRLVHITGAELPNEQTKRIPIL